MESESPSFGTWLNRNLGIDLSDFSKQGNVILAGVTMKPDGGKPVTYQQTSMFEVWTNKDGTVYKLKDMNYASPGNRDKADMPLMLGPSQQAGRVFTLAKDEYEKMMKFRSPMPPAGGPMM